MPYDLDELLAKVDALDEKKTPPKPPGEGWVMVFGRWQQLGGSGKGSEKDQPKSAKSKPPPTPKDAKPAKKKGKIARAKEKVKAAKTAIKTGLGKAKEGLKASPKALKKFLTDKDHRKAVGKKAGAALRRKAKAVVADVKHEFAEFKDAGKAIGKLAKREKLTPHDKKAMKAAVKAIGMTVGGTLAMGGVGHLGLMALGQHFAAETAVKAVGKAALFAHVLNEAEGDEAAFDAWAHKMILSMASEIEGLGDMSQEQLEKIMGSKADDIEDEPEDSREPEEAPEEEPEDSEKEPEEEPEKEPEGEPGDEPDKEAPKEEPEAKPKPEKPDPAVGRLKRKHPIAPVALNTGPKGD